MSHKPLIEIRSVTKEFRKPSGPAFVALRNLDLSVKAGHMVAVVGKSGSGKSTFLNLVAGLDRATSGHVVVDGTELGNMTEDSLAVWRGSHVGVIFQFFQLLPTLTALENVLLAMDFVGLVPRKERRNKGLRLLEQVGLSEQAEKLPATLSGGEQQRVAIARALANDPALIVADEPTGSLDSRNAETIMTLFRSLVAEGRTLVLVTHDEEIASRTDRIVRLADGGVVEDAERRKT